jgi:hypothetical protein
VGAILRALDPGPGRAGLLPALFLPIHPLRADLQKSRGSIRYVQIFKNLENCHDQHVHPQKRLDIKEVLESVMGHARDPGVSRQDVGVLIHQFR